MSLTPYVANGEDYYVSIIKFILSDQPMPLISMSAPHQKIIVNDQTQFISNVCIRHDIQTIVPGQYTIPLLTTKKVYLRAIVEELWFFLNGKTDVTELEARKVNIWSDNTSRKTLDSKGLNDYAVGETGPFYGFQWRHFGAEYPSKVGGFDQLEYIVSELRRDPNSRRAILSAWNAKDLAAMCLPPCHVMYQFEIINGRLNCTLTQRSGDMFLGVPFNMVSVTLLTIYIAEILGVAPGIIHHNITNAHIYHIHVNACRQLLANPILPAPSIIISRPITSIADICEIHIEDIKLCGYVSAPTIKADMIVT